MTEQQNKIVPFEFLLGNWNPKYRIPKSAFSEARLHSGAGTFKRALNEKYVFFDYATQSGGEAHGIFAWDNKANVYRYWWFKNSGNFLTATYSFINDETLFLNWNDTLLIQTFARNGPDKVVLRMEYPNA